MQKTGVKKENSQDFELDVLLPFIINQENQKYPYIDFNKLDYILRDFS